MTKLNPQAQAQRELALRVLCKRKLIPFTQRINPRYLAGWVHEDIARRLEKFSDDVAKGLSPRLKLLMPPRHGKSELASRMFPAWHLGRNPDHEVIACSYNVSLAMSFSRKVKEVFEDPAYQSVFTARLNPNFQGAEEWGLDGARGGYVAAGVGGGITGKGSHVLIIDDPCVAEGSLVLTARGRVPIEHVVVGDLVLTHKGRWRPVSARYDNGVKDVIELSAGTCKVRLTPEHKVYTSEGWVQAQNARDIYGEGLSAVPGVVQLPVEDSAVLQPEVPGREHQDAAQSVRGVSHHVPAQEGCSAEVLQPGVPPHTAHDAEEQDLRGVWDFFSGAHGGEQVLQRGVPQGERADGPGDEACAAHERSPAPSEDAPAGPGRVAQALRPLRRALHALAHLPTVLRSRVQKRCARGAHEGQGESELPAWAGGRLLQPRVQASAQQGGAGEVRRVLPVRGDDISACAPPGRGQDEQRCGESGLPVRLVPHTVSQVVQRGAARVYDLAVEEDHSFVAEGLVVHNCKNAEEADSPDLREKLWDWYGSTAYTRLAPGGGVLIVQTWWHDDDLAGRLQLAMAQDPEADQFEVVKYPAVAEADEWIDTTTDEIVRISTTTEDVTDPDPLANAVAEVAATENARKQGYDVSKLRFLRPKGQALHPERYDRIKLNRIRKTIPNRFWSALYQQNPVPDDGAYFTKDQFKRAPVPAIKNAHVYIAFDFAISEKKQNDYTVGTVGLQDADDMLHVAEVLRFKSGDALFIVDSILALCRRWYSSNLVLGFEDGQIYKTMAVLLKKRMHEERFYPSIAVLTPVTDKMARARPLQGRMQQGRVSFNNNGDWYDTVRQEMLRFPAGVHDDCVDSLAWMTHLCMNRQPPRRALPKDQKSWRDKIKLNGRTVGHMAA